MFAIITDERTYVLVERILFVFGGTDNIDTYKIHTTQIYRNPLNDENGIENI